MSIKLFKNNTLEDIVGGVTKDYLDKNCFIPRAITDNMDLNDLKGLGKQGFYWFYGTAVSTSKHRPLWQNEGGPGASLWSDAFTLEVYVSTNGSITRQVLKPYHATHDFWFERIHVNNAWNSSRDDVNWSASADQNLTYGGWVLNMGPSCIFGKQVAGGWNGASVDLNAKGNALAIRVYFGSSSVNPVYANTWYVVGPHSLLQKCLYANSLRPSMWQNFFWSVFNSRDMGNMVFGPMTWDGVENQLGILSNSYAGTPYNQSLTFPMILTP